MRKHLPLLFTLGVLLAAGAPAQDVPTGFRGNVLQDLSSTEKKLVALAEAIPAEKFDWRPEDGVRSVSEVLMHIASANYSFSRALGAPAPAGIPRNMEKSITEKGRAIQALTQCLGHTREAVLKLTDADLDKPVKMFGREMPERDVLFHMCVHMHEHLGQLIAYARMNHITPPWSGKK